MAQLVPCFSGAMLFVKVSILNYVQAMGCLQLEHQLEALGSSVHVYGHCHVAADMSLPVPSPHVMATTRVAPSNGGAGGAAATRR